jgi:branched-chain amino acid transport system ATP-binding protein
VSTVASLGLAPVILRRQLPQLRQIATETGAAILFVEQHVHMALTVADRAYVISRGEVVLAGSSADLLTRSDLLQSSYLGDAAL